MGKRRYKKNPAFTFKRGRKSEENVFQDDKRLQVVIDVLLETKARLDGIGSGATRENLRQAKRKRVLEILSRREGSFQSTSNQYRLDGQRIFDQLWRANDFSKVSHFNRTQLLVPLACMTEGQILKTPKGNFSDKEWGELPNDITDKIDDSSHTSQGIVDDLEEELQEMYEDMDSASQGYDWVGEEIFHWIGEGAAELAGYNTGQFYGREIDSSDVSNVLERVLSDSDYWTAEVEDWNYEEDDHVKPIERQLIVSRYFVEYAREASAAQIREAIVNVNKRWPQNEGIEDHLTEGVLSGMSSTKENVWSHELEPSHAVYWSVEDSADEAIYEGLEQYAHDESQYESDGEPEPEEDRILYRFKDGAYVVRMIPEDLKECGEELGQCIKDAEHGYGDKLKNRDIDLYSLRTASGRPKLTIEIRLDRSGNPKAIGDILGKGNRSAGWGSKKVKWMEIQKVGKILELLGFDPAKERSLSKAHSEMRGHELEEARKLTQNPRRLRRRRR